MWPEFDLNAKVWRVPAERMKGGKVHMVPLPDRAIEILRQLPRHGDRIFPLGERRLARFLGSMRPHDVATVHGFRSTFRDWAAERTKFPNELIEMALAHSIGDKVEAAYRRGDLFEKREKLMHAWADYCGRVAQEEKVVSLIA